MSEDANPPRSGSAYPMSQGVGVWLHHELPEWPRIWSAFLRRTRTWPVPPRWSSPAWLEELAAEGIAAACTAIRDFDPSRGPSLSSYVYHQSLTDALARYRQELDNGVTNPERLKFSSTPNLTSQPKKDPGHRMTSILEMDADLSDCFSHNSLGPN